jgi:hypothetical protein
VEFLKTVHYEATRAGLDPQMVLGLIQVESGFKKYAVSSAGARGYMQVMPFWVKLIGSEGSRTCFTCARTCDSAAPSCATTSTSKTATSSARWAVTTAAWAGPSTRIWCAAHGNDTGRGPH